MTALPEGNERCSARYEASKAFAAAHAETGPPKTGPAATLFDWELWNPFGGTLILTGNAGNCTGTTADVDYATPTLSARWNNNVSSHLTFSGCGRPRAPALRGGGGHVARSSGPMIS